MLTRRRALGAGVIMIAGWLSADATMKLWLWLNGARASDPESTTNNRHVALGRAYLQRYPEEASQYQLARLVPADAGLRAHQVRADFVAGEWVTLGGWVLSRTECRYCALHALAHAGQG